MAWSLGVNSNSPPFAPAIGANAVSTMRAALLIGILAGGGAMTQSGSISDKVGTKLIRGGTISPLAATTGLLVAASFMAFGVYSGYPVPAAFATTGAMIGVGFGLGGAGAFDTYEQIG
jgi:phosphate/sulfate permease